MGIKLTKTKAGSCTISKWSNQINIYCKKNRGEIYFQPRDRKQVYDIINLIKRNKAEIYSHSDFDHLGRKYYHLTPLYRINYPNKILRFNSNNILEEDFDDIIELLKGVEIDNKVNLNQKDLYDYNLSQLKTILTSMRRRKKVSGGKDNYFINFEV